MLTVTNFILEVDRSDFAFLGKVITLPRNICGAGSVSGLYKYPEHMVEPYEREREFRRVIQYLILNKPE